MSSFFPWNSLLVAVQGKTGVLPACRDAGPLELQSCSQIAESVQYCENMATAKHRSLPSFKLAPELVVKKMLTEITTFVQCLLVKHSPYYKKAPHFSYPNHH